MSTWRGIGDVPPPEPVDDGTLTEAQLKAFDDELEALCVKHGVIFDHEDGHGAGLVYRPTGAGERAGCWIYLVGHR